MIMFDEFLPRITGTIRLLHAAPGVDPVDIYSNGNPIAMNIAFSNITNYQDISPGKNEIQIYKAGTYDKPLYTETLEIVPNTTSTICLVLLESTLQLLTLKDGSPAIPSNESYLRFINLSPDAPLLTLSLPNGDTLFNSVEYLETTGYYPLSPGIYDFKVEATSATALNKFIKDINLVGGFFHTLFIIGLFDGTPEIGSLFEQDGIKK